MLMQAMMKLFVQAILLYLTVQAEQISRGLHWTGSQILVVEILRLTLKELPTMLSKLHKALVQILILLQ